MTRFSPRSDRVESITPAHLYDRIEEGGDVLLVDVRGQGDFEEWHVDGPSVDVVNVPAGVFRRGVPSEVDEALPDDRTITVICAKGKSSEVVAGTLQSAGYDVQHVEDGMTGWAEIYEATPVPTDADATIRQYYRPSSGCLAYLIESDGEAAVIDPLRAFTDRYRQDVAELGAELKYVLDTHVHADHVSGVRELAGETDATAVMPEPAAERGIDYDATVERVADGDTLPVGDAELDVHHTPGHTTGMTAYRAGDVLFSGDGLFTESVARPDLEDDDRTEEAAEALYESLHGTILELPDDTTVAPGHTSDAATPAEDGTYTATLGDLQSSLEVLSMDRSAFVDYILSDMPPRPANYREIIAANLGQRSLGDARAFQVELGPNNCAASGEATAGD